MATKATKVQANPQHFQLPDMLNHATDLICLVDVSLCLLDANQPFQDVFFPQSVQAEGSIEKFIQEQDVILLKHRLKQAEATSHYVPEEITIRVNNGGKHAWATCRIVPEGNAFCLFLNLLPDVDISEKGQQLAHFANQFFDKVPVAILVLDRFQRIVRSNKALNSLIRYKGEEIMEIPFSDLLEEPDRTRTYQRINRCFERNRSDVPMRVRLLRNTGTTIWADISVSIIDSVGDTKERFAIVSVYDTTRYRRTEQKLAVSQTNLQALFDSSIQAHFLIDPDLRILDFNQVANKTAQEVLGKVAFVGEPFLNYVIEERRAQFEQFMRLALQGKKLLEEQAIPRYDGSGQVWFEMLFAPIYDAKQNIVGLSFSALDITARKENEKEIARLSMVAKKSDNAVMIMDEQGKVEWVNAGFTRMTGYRHEEVMQQTLPTLITSRNTNREALQLIEQAFADTESIQTDIHCQNKYGEAYWAALEISPVFDVDSNHIIYFFGIMRDITSLKQQAENLQRLNKSLKSEIEDRKKIERVLKVKNEELNHFIYRASHDLRGPITSLLGLHQLVMKDVDDPNAHEYFEYYHHTAQNLDKLLRNLTVLTEIRGRDLLVEPTLFKPLLDGVIEKVSKREPRSSQLLFKQNIPPGLTIYTDEGILKVILFELIRNAVQYQDASLNGFVIIQAELHDERVKITISDNGIGIPSDMIEYVFKIFHRGENAEHVEGAGVGLYLANLAVERLSGKLSMQSEPGKGTHIELRLPQLSTSAT